MMRAQRPSISWECAFIRPGLLFRGWSAIGKLTSGLSVTLDRGGNHPNQALLTETQGYFKYLSSHSSQTRYMSDSCTG